jgi:hypothetical protein
MDGGSDGTILDQYRYVLDAAALDWVGCCDHDNGGGREYTWWISQKLTDIFSAIYLKKCALATASNVYSMRAGLIFWQRRTLLLTSHALRVACLGPVSPAAGLHA